MFKFKKRRTSVLREFEHVDVSVDWLVADRDVETVRFSTVLLARKRDHFHASLLGSFVKAQDELAANALLAVVLIDHHVFDAAAHADELLDDDEGRHADDLPGLAE